MKICRINNENVDLATEFVPVAHAENIFDVVLTSVLKKDDIKDDASIACSVKIPNTDYSNAKTIVYDGKIAGSFNH